MTQVELGVWPKAFFTVAFFYLCIYFVLKSLADWSQKKLIFREAY